MQWHGYVDEDDASVAEFASWLTTLPPFAQKDAVARMDALEARAAIGEIEVPQDDDQFADLDAIRRNPDVYELRWRILTKQIRQYHGEPDGCPNHLVRLHLHIKGDTMRRDATADSQQEIEIRKAVKRYQDGAPLIWDIAL